MGTALFTTFAGLTGSILLGLQYLVIDKSRRVEHLRKIKKHCQL